MKGMAGGIGMGAGMALSSFAGMIDDEASKTKKSLSSLGEGASQAASAMMMIPGPWGIAAGVAIGLATAVGGIHSALTDVGPKLAKAAQDSKEKFTKLSDSTQKYAGIFQKLQSAYDDPNVGGRTLMRLEKQLADAMSIFQTRTELNLLQRLIWPTCRK